MELKVLYVYAAIQRDSGGYRTRHFHLSDEKGVLGTTMAVSEREAEQNNEMGAIARLIEDYIKLLFSKKPDTRVLLKFCPTHDIEYIPANDNKWVVWKLTSLSYLEQAKLTEALLQKK